MEKMAYTAEGDVAKSNGVPSPSQYSGPGRGRGFRRGNGPVRQGAPTQTRRIFAPHISIEAAQQGVSNGELFEGVLRINQRNYEEAYIDNPLGDNYPDVLICGMQDRNRAFQNDVVIVRIKDRLDWTVCEETYTAWCTRQQKDQSDFENPKLPAGQTSDPCSTDVEECVKNVIEQCVMSEERERVPSATTIKYSRNELIQLCRRSVGEQPGGNFSFLSGNQPPGGNQPVRQKEARPLRNRPRFLRDLSENERGIPEACLQKTAEVVCILERKNNRVGVGCLKIMADGNRNWILFSPNDPRMPRMLIRGKDAPPNFFDRPQDHCKYLYAAHVTDWPETSQFALGELCKCLGMTGEVEAETEGMLLVNSVDTREFPDDVLSSLPFKEGSEWRIDEKEFEYRRDFREETVFTIDPITARDLDDALHIKPIEDCDGIGTPGWEVGVHIADVGYFVKPKEKLDYWAGLRATSVYLVHKVIPMLPRILCEELCSLGAGVDRLTMSVVWKMDDEANVYEEWFGRSVIRSCCKLAYEHAQEMIDDPDGTIMESRYPPVLNKKSISEVKTAVLRLNKLAEILCERRGKNGALRIEQPKLCFDLDEKWLPVGVSIYERKQSNSLVEEFMLLANMAVARKIESAFPKIALLRRHPPPKGNVLRSVLEKCQLAGFDVDGASSGSLASSLKKYAALSAYNHSIIQVLSNLLLRSMQLAVYFCTGTKSSKEEYAHYALSVPFYTHFTSPIRRYPDIMVHRLLSAALKYEPAPDLTIKEISSIASHCNDKKLSAKCVSDASAEIFFGLFVQKCGPLTEKAVVLQVLDASFDVLVVKFGIVKRVYLNKIDFAKPFVFVKETLPKLVLYWKSDDSSEVLTQTIQLCTMLDITLSAFSEQIKFEAILVKPESKKMSTLFETNVD